jgi:hypothetical protein
MIRIGSVLTLIVAAILVFQSCKKNDSNCPFLAPDMVFVGFSETDRDTMIIRRFEKNGQFNSLLDTFLVSKANITETVKGDDSIAMEPNNYDPLNASFFSNDWEIFFPTINHTVRVSEVTPRFTTERNPAEHCQSYVASLNFDGLKYAYSSWFGDHYRVYAVR